VSVEPYHLFRYHDEQAYRFNNRKLTDGERFSTAVSGIVGKRVTCSSLIGADSWEGRLENGSSAANGKGLRTEGSRNGYPESPTYVI
jgi:hypothetical protein